MICTSCNRVIPQGTESCPFCKKGNGNDQGAIRQTQSSSVGRRVQQASGGTVEFTDEDILSMITVRRSDIDGLPLKVRDLLHCAHVVRRLKAPIDEFAETLQVSPRIFRKAMLVSHDEFEQIQMRADRMLAANGYDPNWLLPVDEVRRLDLPTQPEG